MSRSSQVGRVCYDPAKRYMLIRLKQRSGEQTYYHYCEVPKATVDGLLAAESMGNYYADSIRSRRDGTKGAYNCQDRPAPTY